MPFFKDANLLYLHVPKIGGMSIEEYFFTKYNIEKNEKSIYGWYLDKSKHIRVPKERSLQHFTFNEIIDHNSYFNLDLSQRPTIIMSVRNPYDRIISEMFWNKRIHIQSTPDEVADAIYHFLFIDTEIRDNHKIPQYQFGIDKHGDFLKNIQIIHTESLETDMHDLQYNDFNIHKNVCKSGNNIDYKKYLNHRSLKIIQEYYAKDFEMFGYSKYSHYNTTIVSAFIATTNKNRSIEEYISFGKKLLEIPNPKVIFIDSESFREYFQEKQNEYAFTTFIPIEKHDMYLYFYKDEITNFNIKGNKEKDTIDYLFIQCNKTEWVVYAIDYNIYKTDNFIWIDFGIYHMIKEKENFQYLVLKMTEKKYNKLRIASCKKKGYMVKYDVYKILTWTFAGSVFGGNIDSLLEFAFLTKREILKTIREKKTIMWEINIWYLIYIKYMDFFDMYTCNHNNSILEYY
jgi:hypothetical protein